MEQDLIACLGTRLVENMESVSQIGTKLRPPEVAENLATIRMRYEGSKLCRCSFLPFLPSSVVIAYSAVFSTDWLLAGKLSVQNVSVTSRAKIISRLAVTS